MLDVSIKPGVILRPNKDKFLQDTVLHLLEKSTFDTKKWFISTPTSFVELIRQSTYRSCWKSPWN
jgi:hypothetical protein